MLLPYKLARANFLINWRLHSLNAAIKDDNCQHTHALASFPHPASFSGHKRRRRRSHELGRQIAKLKQEAGRLNADQWRRCSVWQLAIVSVIECKCCRRLQRASIRHVNNNNKRWRRRRRRLIAFLFIDSAGSGANNSSGCRRRIIRLVEICKVQFRVVAVAFIFFFFFIEIFFSIGSPHSEEINEMPALFCSPYFSLSSFVYSPIHLALCLSILRLSRLLLKRNVFVYWLVCC